VRETESERTEEQRPVRTPTLTPLRVWREWTERRERGALRGRGAHPAATGTGTVRQLRTLALALEVERRRAAHALSPDRAGCTPRAKYVAASIRTPPRSTY